MPQLLEKLKILHVPGSNLYHVHILKQRNVLRVHDLRHYGQSRCLLGLQQQLQSFSLQPLEIIRRGTRLERSASEHGRSRCLDGPGHLDYLLLRFHRAWSRNDCEFTSAYLCSIDIDYGILRMEFTVGLLERFRYHGHLFHDIQQLQHLHVYAAGVTDESQHRLILILIFVYPEPLILEPFDQHLLLFFRDTGL